MTTTKRGPNQVHQGEVHVERIIVGGPRVTDVRALMFPVECQPVYRYAGLGRERGGPLAQLERFVAVVDVEREFVFSVVTEDYVLVTNEQALDHAKEAFGKLFHTVDVDQEMEVLDLQVPKTRSSCQVDLMHRGYGLTLWDREVYVPYLRFANSYNSTRSLHFYLGFARAKDGSRAVFQTVAAEYKKTHTKKDLGAGIKFEVAPSLLREMIDRFREAAGDLRRFEVKHTTGPALVLKALALAPERARPRTTGTGGSETAADERLLRRVYQAFNEAADEHGRNAYAVYVAAADIATRPPSGPRGLGGSSALQKSVGAWAQRFPHEAVARTFDLDDYLARERAMLAP